MSYVDRILHLQRTIEIIWKQIYLLFAYHLPPLTLLNVLSPKFDHYPGDDCPLLSAVGRLHAFPRLSNRGKGMWISWRIIPIFPPQALTVGTPLAEGTRIPHRGPKHNKRPPILSNSLWKGIT